MEKLCDRCSQAVWNNYQTCVKFRLAAGICTLDAANPCLICESWLMIIWSRLETGSIADSDVRDVDLDFAAVTAHSQVMELSPTSNQLLLAHSTSTAAPVLVTGPSFLPETQAPISMLPGALWPSQPTPYAPRRASSQWSQTPPGAPPSGIEVISTGITQTVAPPPVSSQDGTSQNVS